MKKIFQCEKCGEKFESAEECFQHERQCKKLLMEKIESILYEYGITVTNINEIKDTYSTSLNLILQSGYTFTIDLPSTIDENKIEDYLINALKNYIKMGNNLNGELTNIVQLCHGYDTYCIGGFDMDLIGKLYEGHQVKLEILD